MQEQTQSLYLDLDEFKDGIIAFGEDTFKISRFISGSKSYFLQHSHLGSQLVNYYRSNQQLKVDIPPKDHAGLLDSGIPCSILSPDTNGWQSGKVRLKLQVTVEFYPDNPEPFEPEDPEQKEEGSPLDDLRSSIEGE